MPIVKTSVMTHDLQVYRNQKLPTAFVFNGTFDNEVVDVNADDVSQH
jgi:hypothetical protein